MNIYLISGIVIFVIILSISLYFGLKPRHNDPSSNICKNNQTQCGTGCYDKSWQSCDSAKQICDSQNFSQENNQCCIFPETLHDKIQIDEKGNQKIVGNECCRDEYWSSSGNTCCPNPVCGGFCCENTKYCDYSIVDDNKKNHKNNSPCKVCPYDLCGQNCCASNEKCFTGPSGLISCCLPQLWDPDKKICCNGSTGAVIGINCHPGGNPKCNPSCNSQETCIAENVCCYNVYDANDKIYSCVDQDFNSICCPKDDIKDKCQLLKNGRYICCDDGFSLDEKSQKCFQICGNQKCDPNLSSCVGSNEYKYCQTKGCEWDAISTPDPPNYGDNIIFSYNGPNGLKYYYASPTNSDISQQLKRTITYKETDKDNKCKETDCNGKISEEGASSYFDIEMHNCIGNYSYSDIKEFPSITSNPPPSCPSIGSCVKDVYGNLTGQICLNSKGTPQQSYNGPDVTLPNNTKLTLGDCICNENDDQLRDTCKIFNKETCNNYGNPDYNSGKCICSFSTGNFCENNKQCPKNCSGNGTCDYSAGKCVCNPGYINEDCSEQGYTCKYGICILDNNSTQDLKKCKTNCPTLQNLATNAPNIDQKDSMYGDGRLYIWLLPFTNTSITNVNVSNADILILDQSYYPAVINFNNNWQNNAGSKTSPVIIYFVYDQDTKTDGEVSFSTEKGNYTIYFENDVITSIDAPDNVPGITPFINSWRDYSCIKIIVY